MITRQRHENIVASVKLKRRVSFPLLKVLLLVFMLLIFTFCFPFVL